MTQFVDGMYVEQVRMWTKTKMEAMVKAGFHCGGYPPFGYDKVEVTEFTSLRKPDKAPPKRLVPNPDEAPIVRQAFSLYAEQGSLADVRNYLDSVTSRRWSTTTTKSLLTNEVFRGVQVFGQWRNDAAHEAIVTQELWQAVQGRLGVSASRYAVRTEDDYTYYLRGRVVCPHCGCPATHASQRGHGGKNHYYVCRNANRHGDCPVKRINADKLHASVLGFVRHASEHWTVMRKLISQSGGWATADESQVALRGQLGKQKQALEMRIANYVKVIGEGRFSPAIVSALEKAEAERDTLIEKIEQAEREIGAATFKRPTTEQVQEAWQQICAVWDVLGEEERTDLMGSLVQRVEMTDKTNVTLELLPIPTSHTERFELNSRMGAGSSRGHELCSCAV
jgi:site-specific DNA recombinase